MANSFLTFISHGLHQIQRTFFPDLEHEAGPIPKNLIKLSYILQTIRSQKIPLPEQCWTGRPPKSRSAILNAFIAKAFLGIPTTKHLMERLQSDNHLRLLCGFGSRRDIPSESVFSRTFAAFAQTALPERIHEQLIKSVYAEEKTLHIRRDSTAVAAREKPLKKPKAIITTGEPVVKKRRGPRRKGEIRPIKEPSRVEKQLKMSLAEMLNDLPKPCDRGGKLNSKGFGESWNGYKLHIDTADRGIPVSLILTSASVHDSQVAIPLATMTEQRVQNFYDIMDSAYYLKEIEEHSRRLNHVPLIDINPRRSAELKETLEGEQKARETLHWEPSDAARYKERSGSERTNARLKDEFGISTLRVRGHAKVFCHLMFGALIVTADQLIRLIT